MLLLQHRTLTELYDDFALEQVAGGLRPSHQLDFLDPGGPDPERVGLLDGDMPALPDGVTLSGPPPEEIFGAAQSLSHIELTLVRYEEFR